MFSEEDIESWNEIFPDSKIDAANLAQPSETFLARTLSAYLRVFGYKVPAYHFRPDDHTTAEKRQFLIRLAWNIDRILKITNGAYSFTYYDLIKGTAKKTQHILGILLNYLYYYNMYKKTVFNAATERIQKLEDLQRSKSEAKMENERCLAIAENMEMQKAIFAEKVPAAEEKLQSVLNKIEKQNGDMERLKKSIADLVSRSKELTAKKNELHRHTVSDEEARDLIGLHSKLESDLEEQKQQEQIIENAIQKSINTTKDLNQLMQSVEQTMEIIPNHLVEAKKNLSKNITASKHKIKELEIKRQQYLSEISSKEHELDLFQKKLDHHNIELKQQQQIKSNVKSAKEREVKENTVELKKLQEKEQELDVTMVELQNVRAFLNEMLPEVMKGVKKNNMLALK